MTATILRPGSATVLRPAVPTPIAAPRSVIASARRRQGTVGTWLPTIGALIGCVGLQVALVYTYTRIIATTFVSAGYPLAYPGTGVVVLAACVNLVPLLALPREATTPGRIIMWLLYVMVVLPGGLLPHLTGHGAISDHLTWQAMLIASFVAAALTLRIPRTPIEGFPAARRFPLLVPVTLWLLIVPTILGTRGLRLSFLSLEDVYTVRLGEGAIAAQNPVLSYGVPWLQNVASPMLIAAGLLQRRWTLVAMGVVGELLVYQSFGNRQALLGIALMFICLTVLRRLGPLQTTCAIPLMAFGLVVSVLLVDWGRGGVLATSLLVLRLFIIPGVLTGDYFDFFSHNPPVWLRDGLLSTFFKSPYSLAVVNLISLVYYGDAISTSNAHIWADGFANFGHLGFVIIPIAFGALLWLVDGATMRVPPACTVGALALFVVAWANTSLATSVLTSGVGVMVVVLMATGGTALSGPTVRATAVRSAPPIAARRLRAPARASGG